MKLLLILLGVGAGAGARAPIARSDFPIAGTDDSPMTGPLPMGQQLSTSENVEGVATYVATAPDATPMLARIPVLRSAERVVAAKRALNVAQDEAQRESEERSRSKEEDGTRKEVTLTL